jgi:hypothetical protein
VVQGEGRLTKCKISSVLLLRVHHVTFMIRMALQREREDSEIFKHQHAKEKLHDERRLGGEAETLKYFAAR